MLHLPIKPPGQSKIILVFIDDNLNMISSSLLSFDVDVLSKKRKRNVVSIEKKLEIIVRHKNGQLHTSLPKEYGFGKLTA